MKKSAKLSVWILTLIFILSMELPIAAAICGDINSDGQISIFDVTFLVSYLYKGGPAPEDLTAADVNGTGDINIFDVTYLISWMYQGGPAPVGCGHLHEEIRGNCLDLVTGGKIDGADTAYFQVFGNDLHIYHVSAYYNCGLGYVVDYYFDGNGISAMESDTGEPADCYCYFNLESILYDLDPGEYSVVLIGIEGDTIGTGDIIVEGEEGLIGFYDSGCLEESLPKTGEGVVSYGYSGDTLTMLHNDAFFNCGAVFLIQFEKAGDTLRFTEINIGQDLVWCMCYFNISADVSGIDTGEYVAEVYEKQYYWDEIRLVDRQNLILE